MQTKEEYLAKLKTQLDEWQANLEVLRAKAADASEDVKEKFEGQMAELKAKWDEGAARRDEIRDSADDKWEEFKDEAEEKWAEFKVGVKDSMERVKSFFS